MCAHTFEDDMEPYMYSVAIVILVKLFVKVTISQNLYMAREASLLTYGVENIYSCL